MKKRFIAGVLGIMILATLLAGCGKKSDSVSMWPSDTNGDQVDVITQGGQTADSGTDAEEPPQWNASAEGADDAEVTVHSV